MNSIKRPAIISAVVVAAGRGERMGAELPKPYLQLSGLPILCHTLIRLQREIQGLREIIVVIRPKDRGGVVEEWEKHLVAAGASSFVDGGLSRQDSVEAGVMATVDESDLVIIHDGVRPFFPAAPVREACRQALKQGGAMLAVPVEQTVKREGQKGFVAETVNRSGLWLAQTPQVFRRDVIVQSLRRARGLGLKATDDAQVVEAAGFKVAIIPSTKWNLKITDPDDLAMAEFILAGEEAD